MCDFSSKSLFFSAGKHDKRNALRDYSTRGRTHVQVSKSHLHHCVHVALSLLFNFLYVLLRFSLFDFINPCFALNLTHHLISVHVMSSHVVPYESLLIVQSSLPQSEDRNTIV